MKPQVWKCNSCLCFCEWVKLIKWAVIAWRLDADAESCQAQNNTVAMGTDVDSWRCWGFGRRTPVTTSLHPPVTMTTRTLPMGQMCERVWERKHKVVCVRSVGSRLCNQYTHRHVYWVIKGVCLVCVIVWEREREGLYGSFMWTRPSGQWSLLY